jgi:hypothetical protein
MPGKSVQFDQETCNALERTRGREDGVVRRPLSRFETRGA